MKLENFENLKALFYDGGIRSGDDILFEFHVDEKEVKGEEFKKIIDALRDVVSNSGNIFVPTCTPPKGFPKPTYDPILTPSDMGLFSEYFRLLPNVVRSHNPTYSVAGEGPDVDEILKDHRSAYGRFSLGGDGAFGFESPWDKLMNRPNVYWVLISQNVSESPIRDFINVLFYEKHSSLTRITPFPELKLETIVDQLKSRKLGFFAQWNQYPVLIIKLDAFLSEALNLIELEPASYDSRNVFKEWLWRKNYLEAHGHLKVGFSKIEITPQIPIVRWEGKLLTGIYRDLYARAMVLSHRETIFAFVLLDLLGISKRIVQKIRMRIKDLSGGEIHDVMIACTHSHSTPDTLGSGFESSEYIELLITSVSKAVIQAKENIEPVRAGYLQIPVRGIAHSRRNKLKDGSVFTTRYGVPSTWRVNKELIQSQGEIDPTLSVIRFENLDHQVVGILSNFGCHASVALMSQNISGDFPGEAMHLLEMVHNDNVVAICTNGSAADVDPTLDMPYWGPRNDANASRIGRLYAAQVLEALERVEVEDVPCIGIVTENLDLEVRKDWILLLSAEIKKMKQEFSEGWKLSEDVKLIYENGNIHTEVQGMRINNLFLVGFPGEVFTETGLKLKDIGNRLHLDVVPIELVNDNVGYLVTKTVCEQGGYEAGQHLWGRTTPQAEKKLLKASHSILKKLAGSKTF